MSARYRGVAQMFVSLREVTRQLKDLHEAWSHPIAGGEFAVLRRSVLPYGSGVCWSVCAQGSPESDHVESYSDYGSEWVPGDGGPFDATAAARRLLAAAKDAQV